MAPKSKKEEAEKAEKKEKADKISKSDGSIEGDIQVLQSHLETTFGKDAVKRLDNPEVLSKIDFSVSTRSLIVDKVLAGGRKMPCSLFPFGRQTEIAGLNGSGKTTLCAQIAAEAQRQGALILAMDTEDRIDEPYWTQLGCDTSKIINISARTLEEAFDKQIAAIDLMHNHAPNRPMLLIWDSLGSITSSAMADGDDPMSQVAMGKNVRVISQGIQVISNKISSANVGYLYTNHLYRNISGYGEDWISPGGEKPRFMATVRLRLTKTGEIREEDEAGFFKVLGQKVNVKAVKNSMAPVRLEYDAVIMGGEGFSNDYSIFELAPQYKLVSKGTWSVWVTPDGEEIKYQGYNGFKEKVVKHPLYSQLVQAVMAKL